MSMTPDDIAREMALDELHEEAIMARARREQAIFLFVEGESEECALPYLLESDFLDANGVQVANYSGHGNLHAALRLLRKTLSHDRPVIVTHDNDPSSSASIRRCREQGLIGDKVTVLPIPCEAVVRYPCGHRGGSFEESFPVDLFLDQTFSDGVLPAPLELQRAAFEKIFDPLQPWLPQLRRFAALSGFMDVPNKLMLAEGLSNSCGDLPVTYVRLRGLIEQVRTAHPVVHPRDVELPRVRGLTC